MNTDENKKGTDKILQLVSFNIGDEQFGVNILAVQEIIRFMNVTKVPNSPVFVDGVINLRGKVIPIMDLRARMGLDRREHDKSTRIVIVDVNGKIAGFVVDSVSEVLRIPASLTETPPELATGVAETFIDSIVRLEDNIIILLDLERVLEF